MTYTKYSASGNDFVIFHTFLEKDYTNDAIKLCNRTEGIGADGLVVIVPSNEADFKWLFYNSDGSYASMCGNATRAVSHYAFTNNLVPSNEIEFVLIDPKKVELTLYAKVDKLSQISDKKIIIDNKDILEILQKLDLEMESRYEFLSKKGVQNINDLKNQDIDFLSIDVEGFDFQVLKSNNWEKYKPKVVLIEILAKDIENMLNSEVYIYMKKLNYIYYAKSVHTHFFIKEDFFNFRFSL